MRISDWSSDVCSSDLLLFVMLVGVPGLPPAHALMDRSDVLGAEFGQRRGRNGQHHAGIPIEAGLQDLDGHARRDRKSVVEGKSVSVRVDLGGRRILKKKTKQTIQEV